MTMASPHKALSSHLISPREGRGHGEISFCRYLFKRRAMEKPRRHGRNLTSSIQSRETTLLLFEKVGPCYLRDSSSQQPRRQSRRKGPPVFGPRLTWRTVELRFEPLLSMPVFPSLLGFRTASAV
ncbi:uncharacterized protein [Triticum aestivum]|uniref:uncharacterized protein n=1 Tax=Triticum aestivum TaxID=4565 RepID=UPI001D0300D9|nr:uncharacterized protein LOC123085411 [Triticum aestivum]